MKKKNSLPLLIEIFALFFKIGSFTFGGGFAMIPMIEKEIIDKKGWVKKDEMIDIFAVSQTVPGAVAINSATFIGYKLAGKLGAVFATAGVILPSFLIITLIAPVFAKFPDNPIVEAAFKGIQPVVVALIVTAALKIWKSSVSDVIGGLIALVTVVLIMVFDVSAIITILMGGVIGILVSRLFPAKAKKIIRKEQEQ